MDTTVNAMDKKDVDILKFAEICFPKLELTNIQKNILKVNDDNYDFSLGRRLGKTTILCIKALYEATMNEGCYVLLLSANKEKNSELKACMDKIIEGANEQFKSLIHINAYWLIGLLNSTIRMVHRDEDLCGCSPTVTLVDNADFVSNEIYDRLDPILYFSKIVWRTRSETMPIYMIGPSLID